MTRFVLCFVAVLSCTAGIPASEDQENRLLLTAVKAGNIDAVRLLLKNTSINATEADGTTALHWAVRSDNLQLVRMLVQAGAHVNVSNRYGVFPLTLAAENGSVAMLESLLRAGADPNATLPEGETVVMTAARNGKVDALQVLLSHGGKATTHERSFGETALMWAAAEDHKEAVQVLVAAGADANARSNVLSLPSSTRSAGGGAIARSLPHGGWTALMYAARDGALAGATALADAGADLNLVDPDGTTALVFAIINGHYDVAAMLLAKGADPNVADTTGMAALYAAVDMHTLGPILSLPPQRVTGPFDEIDLIQKLLAHGANPNARLKTPVLMRHHNAGDRTLAEGATPLMRAAKTSDVRVMSLLLGAGADLNLRQKNDTTALMFAAGLTGSRSPFGQERATSEALVLEAVRLCVDRGAEIDAASGTGQSALHVAAAAGYDSVVRLLAERGANLSIRDKQGRTPLDLVLAGFETDAPGAVQSDRQQVVHESTAAVLRELTAQRH